jgi:hypothetical protein
MAGGHLMLTPLHGALMADPKVQEQKLGPFATRSDRNKWAESVEAVVRAKAPFPITYDVNSTQNTNFTEYAYTEFAGGLWVHTQALEINARLMDLASRVMSPHPLETLAQFEQILTDKYNLQSSDAKYRRVCFLPGHNMLEVASTEQLARLVHEEEDVMFKLHPLTGDPAIDAIRRRTGWNRIISRDVSGMELLRNCEELYTSSASEFAITGTVLGKKIHNISNFHNEGSGAYHVVSRLLFKAKTVDQAQSILANLVDCPWSGLIFPWQSDYEARLDAYYAKTLELRELYKPLCAPRMMPKPKEKA